MGKKKKQQKETKQTLKIVAHYLIPTYNLRGNVIRSHVIKSCCDNQTVDVNVWLVNALLGDEQRSFADSFSQQRLLYTIQRGYVKNYSQREQLNKCINCIDNILTMNKDSDYECTVGDSLKTIISKSLDSMNVIYNLKQAKLVAGIIR